MVMRAPVAFEDIDCSLAIICPQLIDDASEPEDMALPEFIPPDPEFCADAGTAIAQATAAAARMVRSIVNSFSRKTNAVDWQERRPAAGIRLANNGRNAQTACMTPEILEKNTVHKGWAKYSVLTVRLPDGNIAQRELEEHGPAVTVLPYDPARKVATLVRQFRAPVLAAGGETSFLEAIAGLTDGEDPQQAGKREALEETGLKLRALEPVAFLWTMPGLSTEQMHLFLAPYGEADKVGKGGGAKGEHENITVEELPLAQLAADLDSGRLTDMKTFVLLQTLRLRKPELFER